MPVPAGRRTVLAVLAVAGCRGDRGGGRAVDRPQHRCRRLPGAGAGADRACRCRRRGRPPTRPSVAAAAAAGTVDAGQGWGVPDPGAAGPFSVTDLGVPFGYRQDSDGAALAAVNAVVAGKYLAATFPDPWAALGFLADPQYADRGGNPALEKFFTGPVTPRVVGDNPTGHEPADPRRRRAPRR